MYEYEITEHRYELVDSLPDGKACDLYEEPGVAIARFLKGKATKAFVNYMTERHEYILREHLWVQVWEPGVLRSDGPIQGLGYARAAWQHVTPADGIILPPPGIATPVERAGGFVWLIRKEHVAADAVAQWNRILKRIVGDGLWQQRWDGHTPPQHTTIDTPAPHPLLKP